MVRNNIVLPYFLSTSPVELTTFDALLFDLSTIFPLIRKGFIRLIGPELRSTCLNFIGADDGFVPPTIHLTEGK
ncbi:hypothetical protein [Candidatus Nitrosocosmicus franklandus]|uniref:hypothetical protein n=1 Tax=Candidatus Nitrosocosmicus franklandianus TaxID=1798806 RepID=UPI001558D80E|nr:hypothetical protein [Candidatus Nitrosocosmicus franklandus]